MNIEEMLMTRKNEIRVEIDTLKSEELKIAKALSLMNDIDHDDHKPLTREEAIIEGVRAGNRKPTLIHAYLRKNLGVNMNLGSLRSTLSRLKNDGRVNRNEEGWYL